jgi:hypothetical protein
MQTVVCGMHPEILRAHLWLVQISSRSYDTFMAETHVASTGVPNCPALAFKLTPASSVLQPTLESLLTTNVRIGALYQSRRHDVEVPICRCYAKSPDRMCYWH